jgi:hypothetical protein
MGAGLGNCLSFASSTVSFFVKANLYKPGGKSAYRFIPHYAKIFLIASRVQFFFSELFNLINQAEP